MASVPETFAEYMSFSNIDIVDESTRFSTTGTFFTEDGKGMIRNDSSTIRGIDSRREQLYYNRSQLARPIFSVS